MSDLISRQAVVEYIKASGAELGHDCEKEIVVGDILNMPPVTPTRKKGKWIKSEIGGAKVCSVCQSHMGLSNFKFCPNCGAEMESEDNDSN